MDALSVVLPVHNEKDSLPQVLKSWHEQLNQLHLKHEFVVCEDGSTDGTKELLPKLKRKYPISLNQKLERRGYGQAVIDGITAAKFNYILCLDSDGQCDPKDFPQFWSQRQSSSVLIGWRTHRADPLLRLIYSGAFRIFFQFLFPTSLHDPSAPYVLFPQKSVLPHLYYLTFMREGFWWGFVAMCLKKGLSIKELPIHHLVRLGGQTRVYLPSKMPRIVARNLSGLIRLKLSA